MIETKSAVVTLRLDWASAVGVFRTAATDGKPIINATLMIDAQTWQPSDRISFLQLIEADRTLALINHQNVFVVNELWFREARQKMQFDAIGWNGLVTHRTLEICITLKLGRK